MAKFKVTHRIVFTPVKGTPQVWDVMLMPEDEHGCRSAAYTRAEYGDRHWYNCAAPSDWERDGKGRWWFQGEAAPGNGTVTVTLRNEVQHG